MSPGRGRPHKLPDERKTAELRIRLTGDERELLDVAGEGKTSTWARGILIREATRKSGRRGNRTPPAKAEPSGGL
jgi:hypothetical protein